MEIKNTLYASDRAVWRAWLAAHFESEKEIWLIFPTLSAGEPSVSYNDAVEEALSFGWIDSTAKRLDALHGVRRFTPRKKGSPYSRPNVERLLWLHARGMIHPSVQASVAEVLRAPFVFPADIIEILKSDPTVWENYEKFTEPYKRIRVAYIDAARNRPAEFQKRLQSFIAKTRRGLLITGYGGVDKYYT
ncbi:MAG: hypothetical protein E7624_08595 [Ruminococcaceae bacterium]|nr:hypothetical protein [Oscillospiraceae bacterium]